MNTNSKKTVILGAGPTGLAAGWEFAEKGWNNLVILEKNNKVGGMVRSESFNGNVFEYGAHYFHVEDKALLERVLKILEGKYKQNLRNLQIKFKGSYFQYPLRINDLVKGFNLFQLSSFFLSMVAALVKNKINNKKLITAEDALIATYGRKLYREFFEDYISSFWGMHPSELSATFALRRIPRMDALAVFKKILTLFRLTRPAGDRDRFIETVEGDLYYPYFGMSQIWDGIANIIESKDAPIFTNCRIKQILNSKDKVDSVIAEIEGKLVEFKIDNLISTIPLFDLLGYFTNADRQILDVASQLRYRSLIIVAMMIDRDRLLPSYCTYFRSRSFSRLSEPKLAGLKVNPVHKTILLAEVSCDFNDQTWKDTDMVKRRVVKDLEEEGIVSLKEIEEIFVFKEKHAYPVFDVGYEKRIDLIKNYLINYKNLYSTGRQGLFQYINSHKAMKSGFFAAEYIMRRHEKKSDKLSHLFY